MRKDWRRKIGSWLLCFVLLASLMPVAAAKSGGEIVGEWLWGSTIADAGTDGAEKIVGRCAEMGVTDIYLLVKGTGGKLGWLKTQYSAEYLSRTDRDVLQEVIDAAHPKGIRVHAWVCNMQDEFYKEKNPEAGMWHYVRERDNNNINPYDEGYQAYMCSLLTELATNYDIDGIHFDYIRYNHACNGWSETDVKNLTDMGADIDHLKSLISATFYDTDKDPNAIFDAYNQGDKDALLLAQYRRNNVVDYAEALISAARAVKPNLIISAALQPDGAVDPAFGNIHYGQSYEDAAKLYDYICPMAYSGDFGKDAAWVASVAKAAIEAGNKVVVGLQAYYPATSARLMNEVNAVKELEDSAAYGDRTLGYMLFRTTSYGYAKVSFDSAKKEMTVKVINTSGTLPYQWVQVELQEGLKAVSGEVVNGFDEGTAVEISEDGSYVKFSGTDILGADSEGTLRLTFEGEINKEVDPALVRIYLTNESRSLNVYEDVTAPDPVTPVVPDPVYPVIPVVDDPISQEPVDVPSTPANPFADVAEGSWYYDAVAEVREKGLMTGITATEFAPQKELTRAELMMVLYRMAGEPVTEIEQVFSDVSADAWYAKAVSWGYACGIAGGNPDGTFLPNSTVTREQLATFLYRYCQQQGQDVSAAAALDFADAGEVSSYARQAMEWAVGSGLLSGVQSGTSVLLQPTGALTRAQLATVLARYL